MEKRKNSLNISTRSFLAATVIIFLLMAATYALTFLVPGGEYARTVDEAGHTIIDTQAGFTAVKGGLPFWKWLLSPFLVLGAEGSGALIAVIAFLLVIGGVFNALHECGLMSYMLQKLVHRFGSVRYTLMAVLILFFMAMGSLVGSFEEVVPLVPIVTSLAVGLGWDVLTGVAMSLLAAGCGFAAGVANPFTIGVAQTLAGLPMFSGIWLRLVAFVCIYLLLLFFVRFHAKRLPERGTGAGLGEHVPDPRMDRGLLLFGCILGAGIAVVLSSGFIPALRDYTMIVVAIMFLVAGVVMILMAVSIRYTLVEGKILDSLLHWAVTAAGGMSRAALVLFIYGICLVLNFFIPSGSAKAFLLIPLIVPLASFFGVSSQICILAFAFGDGFSNVFYPTNPCLLISLGLVDSSYGKWARYSVKFQLMNLMLTAGLLLFGLAVGY